MKAFIRITLFCLLSILMQQSAIAQQYPVTASTQIIPPYSVYLPDYAVPGSDKLRVILVQNDLTQPSYEVRLRMTVEMNGAVIMRTSQAFTPKPLALSPGVPTIISGADLYDYLNSNNIDFSGGFSRETYDRTKALPEGAYRISFTAYDYRRSEVQISNIGANVFFFQKSEPPVLNQPVCDSRVVKMDPQFLTFNWSSRNTPNPLEGSGTEYVFSLYEIKPKNSNPDYIVRSTQPLYTTTTETNTLVYGPGEPQLIDSMDYVWIVQARDKSGRDMYSNQGYSKSCKFSYLSNNPFAVNNIGKPKLNGEATGERTAKLWWPLATGGGMYNVEAYRVQYRAAAKDGEEFDWFTEEKEADSTLALYNLEPSRAYEARLQWRVSGIYGPYSDVVTITTAALRTFSCGESPQVQLPQNSQPLPVAVVGMPVKIGHFDVLLTDVSGSNGVFSGKGRIITPGFGMGLLMEFKGITINTDLVVIRGEMQAVTSGIDKFVSDAVKEQRGGADVGKVKTGDIVPDVTTNLHIFSKDNIVVNTDEGTITLKDSNTGEQEVINYKDKGKTLPLVLEDTDGNLYNIDKNGKVTAAGTRDKSLTGNASALTALNTLKLDSGVVNFTAATTNRYAFDSWKSGYEGKPVLDSSYEKLADGKYRVSAKALVPGEQEDVLATLSNGGSINTDKIKFVSGKGIVYPSKKNGNTWTITLTGGPASDAQEVFAVYPKSDGQYISMGKLLVASYAPLQNKIVLIPIGSTTQLPEDAIRNSLAKAYAKVGVTYTIATDTSFQRNTDWDDNKDSLLQDTKSAFLSNGFTGEEKALKNAYKKSHNIDDNTTYLFLVNEAALKDGDLLGKMPRQSQFGFIFVKNASAEDVGRTVAHETGHGAYTLEHTFSDGIGLSAGTTDNLMDYTKGYDLLKYQWDVVHSPGHVWGIFEGDDASANHFVITISSIFLNKDKKTVSFLTRSGTIISLPQEKVNYVEFQYGTVFTDGTNDHFKADLPGGAIQSFTINTDDKKLIKYTYDKQQNIFTNDKGEIYKQDVDFSMVDGFIYPLPCGEDYNLYKFPVNKLVAYKGGEKILGFSEIADLFKPFDAGTKPFLLASGEVMKQTVKGLVFSKCDYCISTKTVKMTKAHCETPELMWVDRIAQMRNVYPEFFDRFTQPDKIKANKLVGDGERDGNWEVPQTFTFKINAGEGDYITDTIWSYDYPWGEYLKEHPDLKTGYDGSDKVTFFKTFFTEFDKFIQQTVISDDEFWKTFDEETPLYKLTTQLHNESMFHLKQVATDKKELALKKFIEATSWWDSKEVEFITVLGSFNKTDYEDVLKYIEVEIGYKALYDNFYNHTWLMGGKECLTGVLMLTSNMINESGYSKVDADHEQNLMDHPENMPEVEADMLQFKNLDWHFTDANNIFIQKYGEVHYNQIISIRAAGTFSADGKRILKGTVMQVPALQAVLMSHLNTVTVAENTAWLAVDLGSMALGVGGAKILLTAGNYIRKAIVAADLIGSATGITVQLLNQDAISDTLRSRLQMAGFLMSLPNMISAIPRVNKVVGELDAVIDSKRAANGAKLTKEQVDGLTVIREGLAGKNGLLEFADDMTELEQRAITLGTATDVNNVKSWLNNMGDNNVYIVVHADGNSFKAIVNGQDVTLSQRSLAKWINDQAIPAEKQIVLLSCGDLTTAQHLSNKLGRSVVSNDGWVKVYDNGVIEGEKNFEKLTPNGNIDEAAEVKIGKEKVPGEEVVTLGKANEIVRESGEVIGTLSRNGNIVSYKNLAGTEMRWTEQSAKDITTSINTSKALSPIQENMGRITEAKVGEFMQGRKTVSGYGLKIKVNVGELDVVTLQEIIEVKASLSAVKGGQLEKMLISSHEQFCNPFNKKIILYIDEPLANANQYERDLIKSIEALRGTNGETVTVVYSLEELAKVIK